MIISELPRPELHTTTDSTKQSVNRILYAGTDKKYYYPGHATPYLFAMNFLSKGKYAINKKQVLLSEKYFYLLNPGDELSIKFDKAQPLKTLFILFNDDFIKDCTYAATAPAEDMLCDPSIRNKSDFTIPNIPFHSESLRPVINTLLSSSYHTQQQIDDVLFELITGFIKLNKALSFDLQKINAIKRSTKEELYKRLLQARDFMEDNVLQRLALDQIASAAYMNKYHLLDNFKALYGVTPHQYLTGIKLQKAYQLLKKHECNVTEVCYLLGFESLPSFSALFKRKFGITPSKVLVN